MFRDRMRRRMDPEATGDAPQPSGGNLQRQARGYGNVARQIRQQNQNISAEETLRRRRNASGQ